MAVVAIPDGVRIVHVGSLGGQTIINTFGAQITGAGLGGTGLDDAANRHGAAWRARLLPLLAGTYTHTETLAYALSDPTRPAAVATLTGNAVGQGTGASHGAQVCMVATMRTAKRGRLYTGRAFISGLALNSVGLQTPVAWTTAAVTAMQTALNAYKADVDPAASESGGRLAVCSRGRWAKDENGVPQYGVGTPLVPPQVNPVTSIVVRPYLGTQRRRTRG